LLELAVTFSIWRRRSSCLSVCLSVLLVDAFVVDTSGVYDRDVSAVDCRRSYCRTTATTTAAADAAARIDDDDDDDDGGNRERYIRGCVKLVCV